MNDFPGPARYYAVSFGIGTKGYMGTGVDATTGLNMRDFWEYDTSTDTWTQKANFGGTARMGAVGFAIGTKGYIGTGSGTADFWEYDPSTNVWTAKANYGGGTMSGSCGFGITSTGKGYLGGAGLDAGSNFTSKFYEYTVSTNTWVLRTSPPFGSSGNPLLRYFAVAINIGTKGYLGTGGSAAGANRKDWYEFNPATNTWLARTNYIGAAGYGVWNSTAFSSGTKGYLFSGEDDAGNFPLDHREFDPTTNTWTAMASFPGNGMQCATSFFAGGCGYVVTGRNSLGAVPKEVWRWCSVVPAPIELISFSGKNQGSKNSLHWETATETNNDFFTLERSMDAIHYEAIAHIDGAGNSTGNISYSYTDATLPDTAELFYYRLKQTDFDNKSSYADVISLTVASSENKPPVIYSDHITGQLTVYYYFRRSEEIIFEVFDVMGRPVYKKMVYAEKAGRTIFSAEMPPSAEGIYIARISSSEGTLLSQSKFIR
jgi:N-acetylneuraminic acid mutarotase